MKLLEFATNLAPGMGKLITYLNKALSVRLVKIPGAEHFKNSREHGVGIRFIVNGTLNSIRFNWLNDAQVGKISQIMSIDLFYKGKHDSSYLIKTRGISIIQSLPELVNILKDPKVGDVDVFPTDPTEMMQRAQIKEASTRDFTFSQALDDFLFTMANGTAYSRSDFNSKYHIKNVGIFDTVRGHFEDQLSFKGANRFALKPGTDIQKLKLEILDKSGKIGVSVGGKGENVSEILHGINSRLSFKATLKHIKEMVSELITGNSGYNALFIVGRTGVGKTQAVEHSLFNSGIFEGFGYTKLSGTASASGLYIALYHNRDKVLVLDDINEIFNSKEAKDILKAAIDLKKHRTITWAKKSRFIYKPKEANLSQFKDNPKMAPDSFVYTGKIVFVSSMPLEELDKDNALTPRANIVNIDPTREEILQEIEDNIDTFEPADGVEITDERKNEVLEIFKNIHHKDISLTTFQRAINIAASPTSNWVDHIRHIFK